MKKCRISIENPDGTTTILNKTIANDLVKPSNRVRLLSKIGITGGKVLSIKQL